MSGFSGGDGFETYWSAEDLARAEQSRQQQRETDSGKPNGTDKEVARSGYGGAAASSTPATAAAA
jgi:hypothetical protein